MWMNTSMTDWILSFLFSTQTLFCRIWINILVETGKHKTEVHRIQVFGCLISTQIDMWDLYTLVIWHSYGKRSRVHSWIFRFRKMWFSTANCEITRRYFELAMSSIVVHYMRRWVIPISRLVSGNSMVVCEQKFVYDTYIGSMLMFIISYFMWIIHI